MPVTLADITIEHKQIGEFHCYTSPDVKGLYVAIRDETRAPASIQSALDMLDRMQQRIVARRKVEEIMRERLSSEQASGSEASPQPKL